MGSERANHIPLWQFDIHMGNWSVHCPGNRQWLEPYATRASGGANIMGVPNHLRGLSDDHDQLSYLERNKCNACRRQRLQRRCRG